jgi:hypothetical protein
MAVSLLYFWVPNRPAGFDQQHDGHDHEDHGIRRLGVEHLGEALDESQPKPVTIEPRIDPMPPITTTANTTMIRSAPICGLTW